MSNSIAVPFIEKAAPFIKFGIPVIPLVPKDKMPPSSMKGWQKERKFSTDPAVVAAWNTECPDYNVGLVAMSEEDGFCFLEFDGSPGLKKICSQLGKEYPNTRIHRSGKGGGHYIFKHNLRTLALGNRSVNKDHHEWFSFRADRKYLVGAGSTHPNGRIYEVVRDVKPIEMPDWLVDFIEENTKPERNLTKKEFFPVVDDFDFDDWCEFYEEIFTIPNAHQEGWMATDVCPWAGYRHAQSLWTGFYFDGENLGFHCFAQGCPGYGKSIGETIKMMNEKLGCSYLPIWPDDSDSKWSIDDLGDDDLYDPASASAAVRPASCEFTKEDFEEAFGAQSEKKIVTPEELQTVFDTSKEISQIAQKTSELDTTVPESQDDPLKLPETALYGVLGVMAKEMHVPLGLAYPALLTCYSVLPVYDEMDGTRINLFTVLIACSGGGKEVATNRAIQILKLEKNLDYVKASPGSDRGLGELLGDQPGGKGEPRIPGPRKMLLVTEETEEMIKKGSIDGSALFQTFQTLWDSNDKVFVAKHDKQAVNCRLSWIGGVPVDADNPEEFADLFSKVTSHGFISRLLKGYSGVRFNYKKWECPDILIGKKHLKVTKKNAFVVNDAGETCTGEENISMTDGWNPAPKVNGLTPQAQNMYNAWESKQDTTGRLKYHLMKVALLTASANGDEYVTPEGMVAAMRFLEWQARLDVMFAIGHAMNTPDAKATERILSTLQPRATEIHIKGGDEYIAWRRISHDHKWASTFGSTVVNRVMKALVDCGELQFKEELTEDEHGKEKTKKDPRYVKVMHMVKRGGKSSLGESPSTTKSATGTQVG